MANRDRISTYLTKEEQQKLQEVVDRVLEVTSISAALRYLMHLGYSQFNNTSTKKSKPEGSKKPTVCPECGRNKNELGNSTLIVNGNGTWYCTQEDCRAKGRWDE